MATLDTLLAQLANSPRVLLMGQRILARKDSDNPSMRIPEFDFSKQTFLNECLGLNASRLQLQFDALGQAVSLDDKFDLFRRFPWRCIFTSSIDPTAYRLFNDSSKRPVVSAFDSRAPDPSNLTMFRLFGATGRNKASELPPTTPTELRNRRTVIPDMLRQIPRVVGPTGRLFVAGWHPSKGDWLRPRDLASYLYELTDEQVLLFDLDNQDIQALKEDDDFSQLLADGKACLYDRPLYELLIDAEEHGCVFVDQALEAPDTVTLALRKHTPSTLDNPAPGDLTSLRIPRQEFKRLSETFDIPTSTLSEPLPTGTQEEISQLFLDFLGKGPLDNLQHCAWFGFSRPILADQLVPTVLSKLDTPAPQEHTVVLSGQSGAGKSSLMALLAICLRRAGIPVIIIANKLVPPNRRHINDFLQLIDGHSSVATAILWDGLESPDEYHSLSRYIASLGKKALVVGTTYEMPKYDDASVKSKTALVSIGIGVDNVEHVALLAHFDRYLPSCSDILKRSGPSHYGNFFALIYYLTSASRQRLTHGLIAEIQAHAKVLDRYLDDRAPARDVPVSDIASALRKALGERYDAMVTATTNSGNDQSGLASTTALRLVESVMLVSSLGLDMPQSLALSVCANATLNKFDIYRDAFKKFPVITAHSHKDVDHFLRARQPLEAQVWCEKAFPSRMARLTVLLEIASKIDPREARKLKSAELEFVVKLLQTIGPQGSDQHRVPDGYRVIAKCVEDIEQRCEGSISPRLLLVKAHCLREHVQQEQRKVVQQTGEIHSSQIDAEMLRGWESSLDQAMTALEAAEQLLSDQLAQSASTRGTRQMLAVFHTEIAATLGVQLGCLATAIRSRRQKSDFTRLRSTIDQARRAWRRAVNSDEDNIRAIDTACWIIRDTLKYMYTSEEATYDLLAEWSDLIDRYNELDMTPEQMDKCQHRESEFATAIGDPSRLADIVAESEDRGNYSVHALIARTLAENKGVSSGLQYLEDHCGDVLITERVVLLLYYRLWWSVASGENTFFPRDELTLGLSDEGWRKLQELAERRLALEGESENRLALFHLAWSQLQLRQSQRGADIFRQLETISAGSFRRGRTLAIISDRNAYPLAFSGEARRSQHSHLGKVWIEDLRIEIPYKVVEFGEPVDPGELLGPFHIAMNYRGAFAQPVSRYSRKFVKPRG